MSKQEPAEQVRFLVSCIGHTTNGRVSLKQLYDVIFIKFSNRILQPDFNLVAEELGIVSKAAA